MLNHVNSPATLRSIAIATRRVIPNVILMLSFRKVCNETEQDLLCHQVFLCPHCTAKFTSGTPCFFPSSPFFKNTPVHLYQHIPVILVKRFMPLILIATLFDNTYCFLQYFSNNRRCHCLTHMYACNLGKNTNACSMKEFLLSFAAAIVFQITRYDVV